MNYQEIIEYLYNKLPMFSRIGGDAIKPGFTNILALCDSLDNPHKKNKYIHIAGTNGKGSVSHMLASILQTSGYKTGLYTSPHLKDFRERIRINGIMIPENAVVSYVERMQSHIEQIQPSFFEITVAMALYYFSEQDTDIAIIETGLGGRLDSTNIITPQLSVITNIGFDHMHILGNTLDKIAVEKAGIIKPHVPIVIGERQQETESVFITKATESHAPIFFASDNLQAHTWKNEGHFLNIEVSVKDQTDHHHYDLDLVAQYQVKNLLTVLECCRQLRQQGFDISEPTIKEGLKHVKKNTGLRGRWDIIHQHPKVILDVAHNESGMQEVLNQLEVTSYHKLHIIIGMVKDKDIEKVLQMLPKYAIYYFTNAHIPRAMAAEELKEKALLHKLNGNYYTTVNEAISEAKNHAHKDDLILVCGSVFLIGEVNEI